MSTNWKQYQLSLAPRWLRNPNGETWLSAHGDQKDDFEVMLRDAVMARFISICAPDVLERIGGERQLPKGLIETTDEYRARLLSAFDIWKFAGTALGLLRALHYAGYVAGSVYVLIAQGQTYTLDTNLNLVTTVKSGGYAFSPAFWNVFQVIFVAPFPASWSGTPPGNTSDEVKSIRAIINLWRSAQAILAQMVVLTGPVWGFPLTQVWGQASLVWGGATPAVVWTAT